MTAERPPEHVQAAFGLTGFRPVPLRAGSELLGVLNVESNAGPLGADDLHLVRTVADRLASALLLGREQQSLRDRTRLFGAVTVFAGVANAILDPHRLAAALADAVGASHSTRS